jgi:DNA-binding CsgD family transcriptional regulator
LTRVTESQLQRRLLDHLAFLAEEALAPELLDQFAGRLHEDWNCSVGILNYDPGQLVTNRAFTRDFDESCVEAFRDHLYALNPYPAIVEERRLQNRTVSFDVYLSRPKLWKSDYYNLFMRPQCLEYVMGLSIDLGGGARTSFSLYRGDHDGGAFTAEDVRRLDMLRPHLRQTLLFRQLWYSQQPLPAGSPSLSISDPDATCNGTLIQRSAIETERGASEATVIPFRGGRSVRRLSLGGATPAVGGVGAAELKSACAGWQLTEREGEVLGALRAGLPLLEIAESLEVSVNTVRSHVKSIHRKSGFSSTRDLICSLCRRM